MPYIQNRLVHEADSHLTERPDSLDAGFDPRFFSAYHDRASYRRKMISPNPVWEAPYRRKHEDAEPKACSAAHILLRKSYVAAKGVFTISPGNFGLDERGGADSTAAPRRVVFTLISSQA